MPKYINTVQKHKIDNQVITIWLLNFFSQKQEIERTGIRPKTDPRFKAIINQLNKFKPKTSASLESITLTFDQFKSVIELNLPFIVKVFRNDLVIPEFDQFCDQVRVLYNDLKNNMDGSVSAKQADILYISYKVSN